MMNNTISESTWQRPSRYKMPTDGSRVLRFEISSARAVPAGEGEKRHVMYTLTVRQDSDVIDPQPAEVERRYTHFLTLYEGLKKDFPLLLNTVSFPKKVILGNFASDLISHRSTGFESLLERVANESRLRESRHLQRFLEGDDLEKARRLIEENKIDNAIPILENQFRLLNKVCLDRSRPVLMALLNLVCACTLPGVVYAKAEHWAELALRRYEGVSDADLLQLYVPLLQTCVHLWWQRGRDKQLLEERLKDMTKRGMKVEGCPTLLEALKNADNVDYK